MYNSPTRVLLVFAAILLTASCSSQLKMAGGEESSYLLALRAEYLAANPDGMYNDYIKRGEVVKGMDVIEVLASWGHPQRRSKQGDTTERWVYREYDETSKDWIEYTFTFRKTLLSDWDLLRHFAQGGSLNMDVPAQEQPLTKGTYTTGKKIPN